MRDETKVWIVSHKCKNGKTSYRLRWVCPLSHKWKARRVGTDRRRAEREAALLEQQLAEGTYADLRPVSWQDFVDEHVRLIAGAKHAIEVRRTLAEFGRMFNVEPRRVTFAMIEAYVEAMRAKGNTPATVNKKLRCLRLSFNKAVRRGYLAGSPMNGWSWTAEDKKAIRIASDDDEKALLAAAEGLFGFQMRAFIVVVLGIGGRRSEVLGLSWDRIDFKGERVHFALTKGKRDRYVPIVDSPEVVDVLRRLQVQTLKDGGPFIGLPGAPKLDKMWQRIVEAAGVKHITVHDLRRSYVARLIRADVQLPTVQALAGHASIQTTLRYYNEVNDADLRAGVSKLRRSQTAG